MRYHRAMEGVHCRRLVCHPHTPQSCVQCLDVFVGRSERSELRLRYVLEATVGELCLPKPARATFRDGLWQHTCFEVFMARDGESEYRECNFSPSGEWAAYLFRAYREREAWTPPSVPEVRFEVAGGLATLEAVVPLGQWAPESRDARWRLAVAAVIENAAGALGYWALRHEPGRADFHHPATFDLVLEPIVPGQGTQT